MRIWSIHPEYLDSKGLLALWRETLLAKNVLENKTKGYKNHPQLIRFKSHKNSLKAINFYLAEIHKEAKKRNYNFNKSKFEKLNKKELEKLENILITDKQIEYELEHLLNKLKIRDKEKYKEINLKINKFKKENKKYKIKINPLFKVKKGEIEEWEKIAKK